MADGRGDRINGMATNEFRWGVRPNIPGHWHTTIAHEEFQIEITATWIEARAEESDEPEIQRKQAEQVIQGMLRWIGLSEKKQFTATLDSRSRSEPSSGRRDVTIYASGLLLRASVGHIDVVVTGPDGTVKADSRQAWVSEMLRFAKASTKDAILPRMTDYLLEYYADPDKRLAPLFDIIELAEKHFGHVHDAARRLNVDIQDIKDARDIMNDESIRTSRHRGQELGEQRAPTSEETAVCEAVAERIVAEYDKLVGRGDMPDQI